MQFDFLVDAWSLFYNESFINPSDLTLEIPDLFRGFRFLLVVAKINPKIESGKS